MRTHYPELSIQALLDILSTTIKHDDDNKLMTFLVMLSAYTDSDQLNLAFNAPSSSGKSFIPLEVSKLFPPEDVIKLGYVSPTSFFHSNWEYNRETHEYVVDLEQKILIFLDQPHDMVLGRLRPLLSHDEKEIRVQITDKTQKGGMRAKKIVLRGFPAVVFCSADLRMDEQEATRFLLLSPELTQEKLREAVHASVEYGADPDAYADKQDLNPARQRLKGRIAALKAWGIHTIKLEDDEKRCVLKKFLDRTKLFKPRHQRDIKRVIALIKVLALLNLWTRKQCGDTLFASHADIDTAFALWARLAYTQELNISPYVYRVFEEVIVTVYTKKNKDDRSSIGVTQKEIMQQHYAAYGRPLNPTLLRQQLLPMLLQAGLITEEHDVADKRIKLIYPQQLVTGQASGDIQNNSEQHGGVYLEDHQTTDLAATIKATLEKEMKEAEA